MLQLVNRLSPRERECLLWAARGKTYIETSMIVGLAYGTVKTNLDQARYKLNCATSQRKQIALAVAARNLHAQQSEGTLTWLTSKKHLFDVIRKNTFRGNLTQSQVNGMNYLLEVWEQRFESRQPAGRHKLARLLLGHLLPWNRPDDEPIQEYGKGFRQELRSARRPAGQNITGAGMCN